MVHKIKRSIISEINPPVQDCLQFTKGLWMADVQLSVRKALDSSPIQEPKVNSSAERRSSIEKRLTWKNDTPLAPIRPFTHKMSMDSDDGFRPLKKAELNTNTIQLQAQIIRLKSAIAQDILMRKELFSSLEETKKVLKRKVMNLCNILNREILDHQATKKKLVFLEQKLDKEAKPIVKLVPSKIDEKPTFAEKEVQTINNLTDVKQMNQEKNCYLSQILYMHSAQKSFLNQIKQLRRSGAKIYEENETFNVPKASLWDEKGSSSVHLINLQNSLAALKDEMSVLQKSYLH